MSKPDKMPTPWQHPKYKTYYLRKRVPTDIKHLWQESDPVQRSLNTKNRSEAELRICDEWRKLHDEFNALRRVMARQVGLKEELFPDLLDECFHDNLKGFHTLGGFIMHALGRIPAPTDHVQASGWRFEVMDMDRNRVDKVLVSAIVVAEIKLPINPET